MGDIERILKEPRVAQARYRLVPRRLSETQFWRAIFWRLHCARVKLDDRGWLSPARGLSCPQKGAPAALAGFEGHHATVSRVDADTASIRPPLARVADPNGWDSWVFPPSVPLSSPSRGGCSRERPDTAADAASGECRRDATDCSPNSVELYSPHGTALHGYDEFAPPQDPEGYHDFLR